MAKPLSRVALLKDQTPRFRANFQLDAWIGGRSIHNDIEGECVPDFTCCRAAPGSRIGIPRLPRRLREMFKRDLQSRRLIIQSVLDEIMQEPDGPYFVGSIEGCDVPIYSTSQTQH